MTVCSLGWTCCNTRGAMTSPLTVALSHFPLFRKEYNQHIMFPDTGDGVGKVAPVQGTKANRKVHGRALTCAWPQEVPPSRVTRCKFMCDM